MQTSAIDCTTFLLHYKADWTIHVVCLLIGCKGICHRFRNIGGGKYSAYELGFKRCSECDIYIKFAGPRCPCCRYPLRSKKRNYTKVRTFSSNRVVVAWVNFFSAQHRSVDRLSINLVYCCNPYCKESMSNMFFVLCCMHSLFFYWWDDNIIIY